jgi:hypothetical protein
MISVIFNLDGNPHEIIIKDTKYYVKELYGCEKFKNTIVTVSLNIAKGVSNGQYAYSAGIYLWELKLTYLASLPYLNRLISKQPNGINFMEVS